MKRTAPHTRGNALAFCSQITRFDQFRTEIGRRDSTSKPASRARAQLRQFDFRFTDDWSEAEG